MGFFLPSYITTNRLGIYLFQARIPNNINTDKTLFRKSLRTRNRPEALLLAREVKWMFDELIGRYKSNQHLFNQGLATLLQYQIKPSIQTSNIRAFNIELNRLEDAINIDSNNDNYSSQNKLEMNSAKILLMDEKIDLIAQSIKVIDSAPLSQLIDSYLEERQVSWNPKSRVKNMKDIKPKLTLIVDIIGDIESNCLKHSHIITYKKTVFKLPSNRKKGIYKDSSIKELMEMVIPENERLGTETLKNNIGNISSFLKWLALNNYSESNLSDPLNRVAPPSKPAHEQRSIFTPQQLSQIFHSTQYIQGKHKKASHYWVPLLAIFTGARQTELCQLYKSDIYQDEESGIWVIDINEKHYDQSLKRSHHARVIPIHTQLIDMGLIEYVRNLNHERLFSELKMKREGYCQSFSRWFCNTYLNEKNCNIRKSGSSTPVFHSFRHTFITMLDHAGVQPHQIAHIVGHTPSSGETVNRYIKPKDVTNRNKIINNLHYPSIDFGRIHTFQ
ncbi:MAG: site-specific integrase [Colwellia sp.]